MLLSSAKRAAGTHARVVGRLGRKGAMNDPTGTMYLVRHGETEWSRTRRHTSTTDVALTEHGVAQARVLEDTLAGLDPQLVLTSPRSRASETCRLAGFAAAAAIDERLAEWDYGEAEGRTTAEIRVDDPGWSVWTHPLPGGESLDQVAARADDVIRDLRSMSGSAILFGHAHLWRILAARWCGLSAGAGQHLVLDPGSISVLGYEREAPAIVKWNHPPSSPIT